MTRADYRPPFGDFEDELEDNLEFEITATPEEQPEGRNRLGSGLAGDLQPGEFRIMQTGGMQRREEVLDVEVRFDQVLVLISQGMYH